jgi:hypothetical protein
MSYAVIETSPNASSNQLAVVAGRALVSPEVSGSVATYTCVAAVAAGSGDAATQFVSSATGFKQVKVVPVSDVAIAADQLLMVGWSTTADDEVAVTVVLDALRTALGTPDGTGLANVVVTASVDDPIVLTWDGVTTIKTVCVASQGTVPYNVAVITVA